MKMITLTALLALAAAPSPSVSAGEPTKQVKAEKTTIAFLELLADKQPPWILSPRGVAFFAKVAGTDVPVCDVWMAAHKAAQWKPVGDEEKDKAEKARWKVALQVLISNSEPTMAFILWGGDGAGALQEQIYQAGMAAFDAPKSAHKILVITGYQQDRCEALYTRILALEPKDEGGRPAKKYAKGSVLWTELQQAGVKPPEKKEKQP